MCFRPSTNLNGSSRGLLLLRFIHIFSDRLLFFAIFSINSYRLGRRKFFSKCFGFCGHMNSFVDDDTMRTITFFIFTCDHTTLVKLFKAMLLLFFLFLSVSLETIDINKTQIYHEYIE